MTFKPDEFALGSAIPPPAYEEVIASIPDTTREKGQSSTHVPTNNSQPLYQQSSPAPQPSPALQQPPQLQRSQSSQSQQALAPFIPDVKLEAQFWGEDPPLATAASRGDIGLVQILLSQGAAINGKSYWGKPALYHAGSKKQWATFDLLLSQPGINLETTSPGGQTILHKLACRGDIEKVKLLLDKGAKVDARAMGTNTALYLAADKGDTAMMHVLLEAGADTNAAMFGNCSALYNAVKDRREAVVNLLLAHNTDVDMTYWGGESPFHKACAMGDIPTMHKLLQKGAMVDAKPIDGSTALYDAARGNKLEIMKVLLAAGAKVDVKKWGGETPLTGAVAKGNIEAVKLILDSAGGDVDKKYYWISQALAFIKKNPNVMSSRGAMKSYLESLE